MLVFTFYLLRHSTMYKYNQLVVALFLVRAPPKAAWPNDWELCCGRNFAQTTTNASSCMRIYLASLWQLDVKSVENCIIIKAAGGQVMTTLCQRSAVGFVELARSSLA